MIRVGGTSSGVGNRRTWSTSWWSWRALALGMFSWRMEPSWNCVSGQNTKKLQEMVFYNQASLISVKNRVVKVSTFHHPRCVCVYLPSSLLWQEHFTSTAASAVIDICFVFHSSSEEWEGCYSPLHMCREALGTQFCLEMSKKFPFHTHPGCLQYVVTLLHKSEMLMFAEYGNCVQNVMDLLVNIFSNSRSNKCSWWIKTTQLLFLVFQKGDEVCWKNALITTSV